MNTSCLGIYGFAHSNDMFIYIFILFYRYEAEVSEDPGLTKTQSFSVTELLYPPLQATTRTSKNVSVCAVFISK